MMGHAGGYTSCAPYLKDGSKTPQAHSAHILIAVSAVAPANRLVRRVLNTVNCWKPVARFSLNLNQSQTSPTNFFVSSCATSGYPQFVCNSSSQPRDCF